MERVELKSLFVDGNEFSSSLNHFHVSMIPVEDHVKMTVTDEDMKTLVLNFSSMEEAFHFTYNFINDCKNFEDIKRVHYEMYGDARLDERNEKLARIKGNKMTLSEFDIDQAIVDYFGKNKNYTVSARSKLEVYNRVAKVSFYLIEHVEYDGFKRDFETRLTEGDLKTVFSYYLEDIDYELEDYKYIGGVHRVGYFFDEDTPHFEGVELTVKEKAKKLELRKPKEEE